MRRRAMFPSVMVAAVLALVAIPAGAGAAQPGDLLPGFTQVNGALGVQTPPGRDNLVAVVEQADGRLVWALGVDDGGVRIGRYLANGAIDTSFGNGGVYVDDSAPKVQVRALALDAAGRIVFVGDDASSNAAVGRLTANGALDTTFGAGGMRRGLPATASASRMRNVHVAADGSIVATGSMYVTSDFDVAVMKLTPTGDLDTSFSTDGYATSGTVNEEFGNDSVVLADGRVVIAGTRAGALPANRGAIAQVFSTTGTPGSVRFEIGSGTNDEASDIPWENTAIAVAGDSTVWVAQYRPATYPSMSPAIARYSITGTNVTPDLTFDGDGYVTYFPTETRATDMAVQADGRLVLVGWIPGGGSYRTTIARLDSTNTKLDDTFDDDGVRTFEPSDPYNDHDPHVLVSRDGSILLAGNRRDDWTPPTFRQRLVRLVGVVARSTTSATASSTGGFVGASATVTIQVAASGPAAPGATTTRVTVPATLRVTTSPAACTATDSTTWSCTSDLATAAASASYAFGVTAASAGTARVTARTTALRYDDDSSDDTATVDYDVRARTTLSASIARLVARANGQVTLATCGASKPKACVVSRAPRRGRMVPAQFAIAITPSATKAPAPVQVEAQRFSKGAWRAAGRTTVKVTGNAATWSMPKSLRRTAGAVRVRVAVPVGASTDAATSAWLYVRVA